jgi:hypothetical protein
MSVITQIGDNNNNNNNYKPICVQSTSEAFVTYFYCGYLLFFTTKIKIESSLNFITS